MKHIKQPKGEVLQFDDDKSHVMNTSAQRQHDLALYKLNIEKQMVKRDLRQGQRIVKRKLRDLKRTRKSIKPNDETLSSFEKFQEIAKAVSFLPSIRTSKLGDGLNRAHAGHDAVDNANAVVEPPKDVTKGGLALPTIVQKYRPPPDEFTFPMTMRRPSIASTISPLLPILPTIRAPVKKGYQFKDMDDEDFFKMIKRRTQLPEIKQRQKEAKEKSSQMKDKINKFFDPEVEEQQEAEVTVLTPVEDKRNALRGRGFGNRTMTEISEKSDEEDDEEEEETKPAHKTVVTSEEPQFDLKAEILANPVFAAKKSADGETIEVKNETQLRQQKLLNQAKKIIPHALERMKVIGASQKKSSPKKRSVRFH